ncbi:T9SS type A sorting domain-containing protein [bacterium]|nr:T9SS type A sorting domain-containing protein [bacterium]
MHRWCIVGLLVVLVASYALAENDLLTPRKWLEPPDFQPPSTGYVETHFPLQPVSELDEFDFGDTTIVEVVFWDNQHNSTNGRTIQYDPEGDGGDPVVYFIYTDLPEEGAVRKANANKVLFDENGDPVIGIQDGYPLGTGDWSGYPTLAYNPLLNGFYPMFCYHARTSASAPYMGWVASEYADIPNIFHEQELPFDGNDQNTWPRSAMGADSVVHIVTTGSGATWYYRARYDPDNVIVDVLTDGTEMQTLETYPGADVAVSPDGERVAIGMPYTRGHLGIIEEVRDDDNDFIVWLNEDGGEEYDFSLDNVLNITQFQGPDYSQLPDTNAANQDTFRLWLDCNLYFDGDNNLHGAWSAAEYFYLQNQGLVYSQIFYWNEINNEYIRIGDGNFWNNWETNPTGVNNLLVSRPNLVKDPDTGWLYCVFESYGVQGDTTDAGLPLDVGQNGMPSAELLLAASPTGSAQWGRDFEVNGRLWFKPLNITNTRSLSPDPVPPGNCRSETDPSFALNVEGDYLHLFFTLDLDAGTYAMTTPEGTGTDNPMVYYRLDKDVLMQAFIDSAEWMPNIPMHYDGTGFFEDPEDWEFIYNDVPEDESSASPTTFAIESAYPNPFNAQTRIRLQLDRPAVTRVVVYDLLGREVRELQRGELQAGRHEVLFDGTGLASGVYIVRADAGGASAARKIVLMK